ncbi:hypothetical protein LCGC14_0414430 [marine sediment metagenome]|uniref:Uncharacterized protein n=1 Tax=marine sediment metagenome TaxID=412755 RepID=A0A0F9W1V1_9ZZZZ
MTPEEQKQTIINRTTVALVTFGYHYTASWIKEYLTIEECEAAISLYQITHLAELARFGTSSEQLAVDDIMGGVYERNPEFRTQYWAGLANGRGQHR